MNIARILLILGMMTLRISCGKCSSGCIECYSDQCNWCFRRHYTGFGFQCSTALAPLDENCEIYYNQGCTICKKGYQVNQEGKCGKFENEDCVYGESYEGKTRCLVCDGGFPTNDQQKCVKFTGRDPQSENCLWGGRRQPIGVTYCFRCDDGYLSDFGTCRKVVKGFEGCLSVDATGSHCQICDPWKGYNMIDDEIGAPCVKVTGD